MNPDLSITLVQADLKWNNPEANRRHLGALMSGLDTDVVVLPEMFTTGFNMDPREAAEAFHAESATVLWLQKQAQALDALVLGSVAVSDGGAHYNRLIAVKPGGQVQSYDKRHLFSFAGEDAQYTAGQDRLIVEWKGWKLCTLICYDLRFPVWSRNTVQDGMPDYDGLIYVANWPAARANAWSDLLRARAHENACYVAGCNRVGEDPNAIQYAGGSVQVNMKGQVLAEGGDAEGNIQSTWSREALEAYRGKFPVLFDGDPFRLQS